MQQPDLPGIPINWINFRHEEQYKDWLLIVKMIGDPQDTPDPFEWTLKRGKGVSRNYITDNEGYESVELAIAVAQIAGRFYSEGYEAAKYRFS